MHTVTLVKGDGIGPSIMETAVHVINSSGAQIEWEEVDAGLMGLENSQNLVPETTSKSIAKTRVLFKGPLTTPVGEGFRSINVALRQEYNLFANIRPAQIWKGVKTRFDEVDIVVIRENTEGLYAGLEHYIGKGQNIAESIALITREGSEKVIEFAFKFARGNQRKKVTVAHKANILKYSQGIFLDVARKTAANYPDIEFEEKIIDATCMNLVMNPEHFDVIVTTNMFGDILSDLTAGLIGGLGLIPSANIGDDAALFEAVHGSAPDIAEKNIANPTAVILAGTMMLKYLGEDVAANKIQDAARSVIEEGQFVTPDLNPKSAAGTREMGEAIINAMR